MQCKDLTQYNHFNKLQICSYQSVVICIENFNQNYASYILQKAFACRDLIKSQNNFL